MTVLTATAVSLPISLGAAIFVTEWPASILSRVVRLINSLILETPTIIVGLVIYAVLVIPMRTFSALAASVALSIVMLPYMTSGIESAMKSVPTTYKEAGFSLGMRRAAVICKIVLKMASRGVAASIVLGIAKAAGETAPLLFTAGGMRSAYPGGITSPVDTIPLLIYYFILLPSDIAREVAWGASLVLLCIFAALFTTIKILGGKEVRY